MSGRKFTLYFSWSRPQEIGAPLGTLENRFPTLFEFRRAFWPTWEHLSDPSRFKQDITGFLDHIVLLDFTRFNEVISEETGHLVSVIQRLDDKPPVKELDDAFLRDVDTLIIVSLDHLRTAQRATQGEIQAIQHFLQREDSCLIICPHHDVGTTSNLQNEFIHHGDSLVPAQQRLGGFAKSILDALNIPIENQFGLHPATAKGGFPAPLDIRVDLDDKLKIFKDVTTFNLHPHLPHLQITAPTDFPIHVMAKQKIDQTNRHPFVDAGNSHFNAFCWIPPANSRAGNIFVCDATLWSEAFNGMESLIPLWKNLAAM